MHFGNVLEGIWPYFSFHLAIKILSKNALEILLIFRSILGGILGALGLPFGSQNRSKNRSRPPLEHREAPGACPGASGPSKVTKNGAQSEPKTLKIDPLDASRLPKRSPRAPNMESQNTSFPTLYLVMISVVYPQKLSLHKPIGIRHPDCLVHILPRWAALLGKNDTARPTQKKGGGGASP